MTEPRIVPAPWKLRGESFIQILLNPVEDVRHLVPEAFELVTRSGRTLGGLMYVHYTASPVGPYEELLFMPARVRFQGRTGYCITHIWVDSPDSVESGTQNWLIPKRLGRMAFRSDGRVREAAIEDRGTVAVMRFRCPRFPPPLPAHSLAFPMPLLQERDGRRVFVPFGGWGFTQPVQGGFVIKNPEALPVPARARRLPPMRLANFRLTFSKAQEL
jgi:hypothetical protein